MPFKFEKSKKYLYEGLVIVISVLLAFYIDAWWSSKNETRQKKSLLIALKEDFVDSREQLIQIKSNHLRIEKSLETLLIWSDSTYLPLEIKSNFDSLLGVVFWRQVFDPPMGAVESIVNSGRFDILSNSKLVSELTAWSSIVDDLNEAELSRNEHFYNSLYPYLSSHINLKDFDKGIPSVVPWKHSDTNTFLLLENKEFQNILYMHYVLQLNINWVIPKIEESIASVTQLVNKELH
jgi:hypothetical protein